jgi:DNA-binding LacI/PurR family transcriptional regulator
VGITIRDVAKAAKVSVATVSRALSGSRSVSKRAMEQVQNAARALGYVHGYGRDPAPSRTGRMLVLVQSHNDVTASAMKSIERIAYEKTYVPMFCITRGETLRETRALDSMFLRAADGVIVVGDITEQAELQKYAEAFPLVMCMGRRKPYAPFVGVDPAIAGADAAEYLRGRGCKNIALIAEDGAFAEGVCRSLNTPRRIFVGANELNVTDIAALLTKLPRPDAVICSDDEAALFVCETVRNLGYAPGKDIAVIGYGNRPCARENNLTSIEPSAFACGRIAAETLISMLTAEEKTANSHVLPHSLILRGSTEGEPGV